MESLGLIDVALIIATSVGGALLIAALGWIASRTILSTKPMIPGTLAPTFLFDGDMLADATLDAQQMLKNAPSHLTEKQALISVLNARFPTLAYAMDGLASGDTEYLTAADDAPMSLRLEHNDGLIRVSLIGTSSRDSLSISEIAAQDALEGELSFLRSVVDESPHPMWMQDSDGKLTWANAAYLALSDRQSGDVENAGQSWPNAPLFPHLHLDANPNNPVSARVSLPLPDNMKEQWFDVTTQKNGKDILHYASSADDAVKAEQGKTKAMQTSARLFGELSTGLAIFDQRRRLASFNPALTALTRLQPSFLLKQPTLDMFLDALRETRILPEPKNYASWRDQFTALETAARAGTYCENWDSIDGQTFRVTGRPYADNSFVFLFEDISADVALTRHFRASIETGQGVIDTMEDAVAVFSANGTLVLSNKAYKELWGSGHDGSVHSHNLRTEIVGWQSHCAASPTWSELRSYISASHRTEPWTDHAILNDGRHLECRAQSVSQNMTMVTFGSDRKKMTPIVHKLTMPEPAFQRMKS